MSDRDRETGEAIVQLLGRPARRHAALARALGVVEPEPEPEDAEPADGRGVDFDGGARETVPLPPDPVADHNEVVGELLRDKQVSQMGAWGWGVE